MNIKAASIQALQDWRTRQGKHINGYRCFICNALFPTQREAQEHTDRAHPIRFIAHAPPTLYYYKRTVKAPIPL